MSLPYIVIKTIPWYQQIEKPKRVIYVDEVFLLYLMVHIIVEIIEMIQYFRFYRLTQISLAEAGDYTCTVTNGAGTASAVGSIVVQTYPEITIIPNKETITVREGQYVRLECRGDGIPKPTVQWLKPYQQEETFP